MQGDVGIRELKAHLSEVLERAANGERIRVTDRGKPKALIVPLPGVDRIAIGIREGWITPGPGFGKPLPPLPADFVPLKPSVPTIDIINEDRGE